MSQHSAAIALVNRLKFKHLALLVALDDARNLHQAAEAINVAQPSASRMLGDIEEAFGFLLFERNARGMTPTPLGVVTLAYARRALAELTRFAEDLEVKRRGGHGQLTVGAIMGAAPDLLAMAVAALKTESPLLNVRILGETSDQVVQLLHRREVDLALGRLTSPLQHNDFSFEPLARETLLLVVRSVHPLAQRSRISLRELIDWPWVAQPVTSPARVLFEEELARAGLATPVNLTECASIFATLQLLDIDPATFAEMEMSGGRVAIPVSSFATHIAGTDMEAWVRENATIDPDELALSEAASYADLVPADMADAYEQDVQAMRDEDARKAS
ncbi:LysR family transcriptional regulator, partial [Paraburkholderia fungorum]|uniref:LysR family transcriptional regulator n=1 Tax=Paraburkholderia fungorum TaxID=134537 RepID=UPI00241E3CCD